MTGFFPDACRRSSTFGEVTARRHPAPSDPRWSIRNRWSAARAGGRSHEDVVVRRLFVHVTDRRQDAGEKHGGPLSKGRGDRRRPVRPCHDHGEAGAVVNVHRARRRPERARATAGSPGSWIRPGCRAIVGTVMTLRAAALSIRAPLAWFGPGRRVEQATVVVDGDTVIYAGEPRGAPPSEVTVLLDGVLLPAAADRHVHMGLSDPGAVLLGGVTAVRDLAWPSSEIFPLADASEGPNFNGPLVRAAGPMLTAPAGYPTRSTWAPPGTGWEIRGPDEATAAVADLAAR